MSVLMLVFGAADVLAALALYFPNLSPQPLISVLGWFILLKGLYSIIVNYIGGTHLDAFGIADLSVGVVLLTGWIPPFFWILPFSKGVYSMIAVYGTWYT